jgi:predicted dehydrogenase
MIGPNDTITAAIIGTGSQGCYLLERAVKVPNIKWVLCCDIQDRNLVNGLKIAKGAEGCKDYKQVLDRKDIQAVIIATPIALHAPMAIDALRAGKHVLSEKMMAYSIEDARHMARVARQTGRKLQIGHQRRYDPNYQHAHKMINEGVIGKVTHVRAQWNRNASWRRPVPKDATEELVNWRLYRKSSQGLMAELGSHQVDVVNWIVGQTPSAVVGIGGLDYWKDGRDVFDNVQVVFEYPGGIKMVYTSITTNAYDDYGEQLMGDAGTIVMLPNPALLFRESKAAELDWMKMAAKTDVKGKAAITLDTGATAQKGMGDKKHKGEAMDTKKRSHADDYRDEFASFFDCLRTNKRPFCCERAGLQSAVTVIKANEAMEKRTVIDLTPDLFEV